MTDSDSRFSVVREDLVTEKKREASAERVDLIITVLLVVLCVFVLWTKYVWLEPIQVKGSSMENTLHEDDLLVLDRLASPSRGDVIVFTHDDVPYIKRVIGLSGDTVKIDQGKVYLRKKGENEYEELAEEYAKGETYVYKKVKINGNDIRQPITDMPMVFYVGENEFFAMGDNRTNSIDCRDERLGGALSLGKIDGVVHDFFITYKNSPISKLYKYL